MPLPAVAVPVGEVGEGPDVVPQSQEEGEHPEAEAVMTSVKVLISKIVVWAATDEILKAVANAMLVSSFSRMMTARCTYEAGLSEEFQLQLLVPPRVERSG